MYILGISCFYHDSAATLIKDWHIIWAVQEERFSRKKHDESFPSNSIKSLLKDEWISIEKIDYFVYYEKPFIKFERLLETFLSEAPFWFRLFISAIPIWLKEKLFLKKLLIDDLSNLISNFGWLNKKSKIKIKKTVKSKLRFAEHHHSHAASAFYPSPFNDAAILTIDWVGEWTTTSLAHGIWNKINFTKEIHFPHSLGLFYSAFTYYLWFKVNSWEYKVMWLAPYWVPKYSDLIKDNIIDIKNDWSFKLNLDYFNYTKWLTMVNSKFEKLFSLPIRKSESKLEQKHMDIAASLQIVLEEVVLKLVTHAKESTWSTNLCLAWWVALNCVANWKILKEKIFDNVWIQPASWDAWWALGAALALYYWELDKTREINSEFDSMHWSYLGPSQICTSTVKELNDFWAKYEEILDDDKLFDTIAKSLDNWKIIGWHQWRMEFWPRSLWNRSILWDPRKKDMQKKMNLKIKYRESFRPFAPSILQECLSEYFDLNIDSPYMLLVAPIALWKQIKMTEDQRQLFWIDKLNIPRSHIPATTHVDYSSRVQTVHKQTNPKYHWLITKFYELTWCPILVNTSFNVRWEPIVSTARDAYRCFMRTEMDILVIDNFVIYKGKQPSFQEGDSWKEEFELD